MIPDFGGSLFCQEWRDALWARLYTGAPRQTDLLFQAWEESGEFNGYRKLYDDLLDQGELCCPNRVARLTRLAGIKAEIGDKRRPGKYGGRPSAVVNNTLELQFDVEAADRAWVFSVNRHAKLTQIGVQC